MSYFQHHPDNKKTVIRGARTISVESRDPHPCSPFRSFPTKPDEAMELLIDEDDKDIVTQKL